MRTRVVRHLLPFAALIACTATPRDPATDGAAIGSMSGSVTAGGRALPGAFVSAEPLGAPMRTVVRTDAAGRWTLPALPAGQYVVRAHGRGVGASRPDTVTLPASGTRDVTIVPTSGYGAPTSAEHLALLPEGETKRRFILDCTGCHQFDARIAFPNGVPRDEAQWRTDVARMLTYAGAHTPFPVIAAGRDPDSTARWLASHVRAGRAFGATDTARRRDVGRVVLTEYDYPLPQDLPHDLAVERDGKVVITGMFSHKMWRLDPATGAFEEIAIPVDKANPRAVDIDSTGAWWVVLGAPQQLARRDAATGAWTTYKVGVYPHSLAIGNGRVWYNGHFTKEPEIMGYVDVRDGSTHRVEVPNTPELRAGAGPIPYEIRVSRTGTVWMTELQGNRVMGYDPATQRWESLTMPTTHSGPRRMDLDASGVLWIPGYSANTLVRHDPATGRTREYRFPVADALPYVVRVDRARGTVWGGTAAADALFSFDSRAEAFTVYPLPTPGALIRHLAIDDRTGELWAAYGASPGVPAKIVRLRVDG